MTHAAKSQVVRDPARLFAPPAVELERRADGTALLRSPQPLKPYARCVGEYLVHWAGTAPDRHFLMERGAGGTWNGVTYRQTLDQARRIAAWLLQRNLSAERPLAILSDNSIEHGLLALAAMHVGVPIMPISPAYALMSKDFGKLKSIFTLTRPGLIFVAEGARSAPALAAVRGPTADGALPFSALLASSNDAAVERAFAAVTPDTVAKFLFTSGSTDEPK